MSILAKLKNRSKKVKNTKEITRVITAQITVIQKVTDEQADEIIAGGKTESGLDYVKKVIAERINADDVKITGLKDFVMDIKED